MRHLLRCWHDLARRLNKARQILLFLDYDGTLTPIAPSPEMAALPSESREVLEQISHEDIFRLAIISGRSLHDIKMLIGLEDITYAGNHGLEIECPPHYCPGRDSETTTFVHPIARQFKPRMKRLERKLKETLAGIDGLLIENKGLTLSLHYRLARNTSPRTIEELLLGAIDSQDITGKLQVTEGKKVFEVKPLVDWDKGKAVEWLMEIYGSPADLPIFAGDDITDEDGFRVMHRTGGISIFIGNAGPSSTADYYLASPEQLCHWLQQVIQETR